MVMDQFGVRNLGTKIWLSENIEIITVTEKRTVIQSGLKIHIMFLQIKNDVFLTRILMHIYFFQYSRFETKNIIFIILKSRQRTMKFIKKKSLHKTY